MQQEQLMNSYKHLYHASVYIEKGIYIDPFNMKDATHDAKYIFITHPHFDHLSITDIRKILNDETVIICTRDSKENLENEGINNKIIEVIPNKKYSLGNISFETIKAYNQNKKFHPLNNGWVGYIIEVNGVRYCHLGDSDYLDDYKDIKCDVLFVPIGGIYTMDYVEGAKAVRMIKPKVVVPIHFNSLDGLEVNINEFYSLLDSKN